MTYQQRCAGIVALTLAVFVGLGASTAIAADLDCADFGTREAANRELDRTLDDVGFDVHRLDADGDGEACERNGSAVAPSGIGAGAGVLIGFALTKAGKDQDDWSAAIGHAILAAFVGAFAGWMLPGILPSQWTVTTYAAAIGVVCALIEYNIASRALVVQER